MDTKTNLAEQRVVLLLAVFLFLAACSARTTPPGPNAIAGAVGNTSYTLLAWDEGLRILIWTDLTGAWGSTGSGSTEDEVYREEGYAEAPDGQSFVYYLETRDGLTASFSIDDKPFDLEQGSLFLVVSSDGEIEVTQLDYDLSTLTPTNEGIEAFGQNMPAIADMMEQAGGR